METISFMAAQEKTRLYRWASALAVFTIFYNIAEGLASVFFGLEDASIALFGFGLDSFVEVVSGVGIWHMVRRLRYNHRNADPDRFEQQALKITGTSFYLLSAGLMIVSLVDLFQGHRPETTVWGIIVSSVSILTMWLLVRFKLKVGRKLNSEAIISDAHCTRACMYLSFVLLFASVGYELTGIGSLDSAGTIVIAWLSLKEGREAFQKAAGKMCGCKGSCH